LSLEVRKLADGISSWIRLQVRQAGAKGVVLGVSGGADSAVVAVLSKMAVGDNVLALLMPIDSSRDSLSHAKLVAGQYKIRSLVVDLSAVRDSFLKALPPAPQIAEANLRPRLRMAALYYFACLENYLVAGTGNRSEIMLGYFTKYGDGGVDVLPLGDIYKGEVLELARELGLPDEIVEKPPSADLWVGQTDEKEIGLSYAELDAILAALDSGNVDAFDRAQVGRVKEMLARSEHKRRLPPIFSRQP